MSDPQDVSSVMEAAAHAAGAGDFVSAERELRRGLALQEALLGPAHPDLANTLNNLGVVAERLNRPADAERWYRRAYAIASGVLQPDHPFVVMSAKNLRDFCDARGIPFERSVPAPAVAPAAAVDPQPKASWPPRKADAPPAAPAVAAPPPAAPAAAAPPPAAPRPAPHRPPAQPKRDPVPAAAPLPAVEPSTSPRFLVIAAIVLAALIVGGVWTMMASRSAREEPATAAPSASAPAPTPAEPAPAQPAPTQPSATPPATAAAEQASPAPPAAAPVDPQPQGKESSPPAPAPKQTRPAAKSADAAATLVSAQLCRPLTPRGSWNCTPASDRVAAGVIFYYTKVTCPADTTIEHRWYFNDRLLQSVALRVRANNSGYRTYSRTTIGPERAGNWRVELLAADGTVLHEERFSVTR